MLFWMPVVPPTFNAPDAPEAGMTLTFEVTVSDSDLSNTDEVSVTIADSALQAFLSPIF